MVVRRNGDFQRECFIRSIIAIDNARLRELADAIRLSVILQRCHVSTNALRSVNERLIVVKIHTLRRVRNVAITSERLIESAALLSVSSTLHEALFQHETVSAQEAGFIRKARADTQLHIVGVDKADRVRQHINRKIAILFSLSTSHRGVDGNELLDFVRAISVAFALELVEDKALNVREEVRVLLNLVGAVDTNSITAWLTVKVKLMVDSLGSLLGSHGIAIEEQLTNVLKELISAIVQLIVVPIEQTKLLSLIEEAVDYKPTEVSSLTTGTVGRTHINFRAIAVNVGQAQQLSTVLVVAHYLLSSFCVATQ